MRYYLYKHTVKLPSNNIIAATIIQSAYIVVRSVNNKENVVSVKHTSYFISSLVSGKHASKVQANVVRVLNLDRTMVCHGTDDIDMVTLQVV